MLYEPVNNDDDHLSPNEQVALFEIAAEMKSKKLPEEFIAAAVKTAVLYEGVADLMKLWRDETDQKECNEIIADIQELIDDSQQKHVEKFTRVRMNDLDAIAKDIRAFKDSLLTIVDQHGGITRLAELTQIPQPSLSRFFNSNAMPRRMTLLKIAAALNLDSVDIKLTWSR